MFKLIAALALASFPLSACAQTNVMYSSLSSSEILTANMQAQALVNMCPVPMPNTMANLIFLQREAVGRFGPDAYVLARVQFLPSYEAQINGVTAAQCIKADKAFD